MIIAALQLLSWMIRTPFQQRLISKGFGVGDYKQFSVFFSSKTPLAPDGIRTLRERIRSDYLKQESGVEENSFQGYLDAYSFDLPPMETVSETGSTALAKATVTEGDFFQLNFFPLIHGAYFENDDSRMDLVVIDERLAWNLYGSGLVSGKQIFINGVPFLISGVIRETPPFSDERVYGVQPRLYLSAAAYQKWLLAPAAEETVVAYASAQFLLPDPLDGTAASWLENMFQGDQKNFFMTEEDTRFSVKKLLENLTDLNLRNAFPNSLDYPYWESAARVAENKLSALLGLSILSAILVVVIVLRMALNRSKS